ncbi:hypothetical protein [Streptomyces sp. NPDC048436]|uniref:hypothetical protein n=1 Tax=Streptomyces sp. NPDC048436 TaxID=3365550 RepID=UPI0037219EFD
MANAHPNQPKKQAPPKAGTRPSVRIDETLAADLAVVMSAGDNFSDVVRQAVGQLADIYRTAWANGVCPPGTAPNLLAYQLGRRPAPTAATEAYDASAAPAPRPTDRMLPGPPPGPHLRPQYARTLLGRPTGQPPRPDTARPTRA